MEDRARMKRLNSHSSEVLYHAVRWAYEFAPPVSPDFLCPWCDAKRSGEVNYETRRRAMEAYDSAMANEDPCPVCAALDA